MAFLSLPLKTILVLVSNPPWSLTLEGQVPSHRWAATPAQSFHTITGSILTAAAGA